MTKKKDFISAYNKVVDLECRLMLSAESLSRVASEYLGFDVNVELCAGSEIEFRRVSDDGLSDDSSTFSIEEILFMKK